MFGGTTSTPKMDSPHAQNASLRNSSAVSGIRQAAGDLRAKRNACQVGDGFVRYWSGRRDSNP